MTDSVTISGATGSSLSLQFSSSTVAHLLASSVSQLGLPGSYESAIGSAIGADTITAVNAHVTVGSGHLYLPSFVGSDTIASVGVSGALVFETSSGSASLVGGLNAEITPYSASATLTGGVTVFGGSGSALTEFGAAAGNMVLLAGFGTNAVQTMLATQTHSNGGSSIMLGDTKITFLGVNTLDPKTFGGS